MEKLKKKDNKKTIIVTIVTMALLVLVVGISFAEYKQEAEVTFINAKVADFRVSLSNVTATSTNNSVNLSYTASGYNATTTCTFGTTKGNYNIGATSVNNNNCTKTGLNQNTTYYYKVCTKNKLNQESCREGSINTKYNAPTLSNITATSTTNSIRLTYTVTGHAPDYLCKWGTSNGNYPNTAGMSLSECNITGLTQGVTYYYRVCVSNNGGQNCKTGNTATKLNPPTVSSITATSTYNSINLSYTMSGTVSTRTCKYGTSNGSYTNSVSNPSNTGCSITGLAENTTFYYQVCGSNSGGQNCKTGSIATKKKTIADEVQIGDYISMTPTLTSYKIATTKTGYTSAQTINPSELNLWRVIRKNADGTVDMVSHNVSTKAVSFKGKTGYKNYIGTLNEIAASYTNSNYVYKTRHMGYSNQTEFCTEYNSSDCVSDTGYKTDIELVNTVYGGVSSCTSYCDSLKPGNEDYGPGKGYFVAGRKFYDRDPVTCQIVSVDGYGNLDDDNNLVSGNLVNTHSGYIRPVLTLKSTVKVAGGNGSESSPYSLSGG